MTTLPAQPNQSLLDGVRCLQHVAGAREPVGSRETARALGMEPTRANRLLKTLAAEGYLMQDAGRKYRPGPGIHALAAQSLHGSRLLQTALPHLRALRKEGRLAALGVLWRTQVSYLYHGAPGHGDEIAIAREGLFPAERSSIGLVMLAELSDETVRAIYRERPEPEIEGGMDALFARLDRVRRDGFAAVRQTYDPSLVSLAVAIGKPALAALATVSPVADADQPALAARLRAAATEIDNRLHPDKTR